MLTAIQQFNVAFNLEIAESPLPAAELQAQMVRHANAHGRPDIAQSLREQFDAGRVRASMAREKSRNGKS
jgi:hypothetical protein